MKKLRVEEVIVVEGKYDAAIPGRHGGRRQLRRGLRPRDVWICLIFYRRN